MNKLTLLLTIFLASFSLDTTAMPPVPQEAGVAGTVLESKDAGGYTYLRLRTKDGELWAAVPAAQVKVGTEVKIANPQTMTGFKSKTMNRSFDRIVFGTLAGSGPQAAPDLGAMHAGIDQAPKVPPVKVEKAKGPNAQTVAGIAGGAAKLKDKPVTVRGQVVKFTADIMGKNWLHLRDGSGSAADGTDDVIVVTSDTARVGDVVLVNGMVRTDRNLGMGYSYKVLVDEAKVTK
jgi:hypothetical protein